MNPFKRAARMAAVLGALGAAGPIRAADQPPSADPKPVPATREEEKAALEAHKNARPRLPLPPSADGSRGVNNGRMRQYYLPDMGSFLGPPRGAQGAAGGNRGGAQGGGANQDPAMTLDNTFKVKLFWITSRANNCYYCLGHQEHKLLGAGVSDDEIASLDSDWSRFTPAEQAAFAFTRKLAFEPYKLTAADVEEMKKHYTPTQVSEIVLTVAGFNAMNRWTDGLNIPADDNGNNFRQPGHENVDLSTFKTPTASKWAGIVSKVAPLPEKCEKASAPAWPVPPLEDRAAVEAAVAEAKTRKAALPLADGTGPNWERMLMVFPRAGKSRVDGYHAAAEKGDLSPRVKAEIAWVAARTDRARYALAVARERLKALGFTDDQMFALDGSGSDLPANERVAVAFARKLTAAPATVTDMDVEGLRKLFKDKEVAEIVHQVCNAAFFDRVTEAAQLPPDR